MSTQALEEREHWSTGVLEYWSAHLNLKVRIARITVDGLNAQ